MADKNLKFTLDFIAKTAGLKDSAQLAEKLGAKLDDSSDSADALAKVMAATAVPIELGTLLVPAMVATGTSAGSPMSRHGSWISPPPPTIESTHPARKAAATRKAMVAAGNSSPVTRGSGAKQREQVVAHVVRGHLDPLARRPVAHLDDALGQAAAHDHRGGHAQQLGVGELHPGAGLAVIQQDGHARGVQLGRQLLGELEHRRILAGRHQLHVVRREVPRPGEAQLVARGEQNEPEPFGVIEWPGVWHGKPRQVREELGGA